MLNFKVFGIPTRIHWMFWVTSVLLSGITHLEMTPERYQGVVIWVGCCFISILWHELGHALTARKFGARPNILLWGLGGLAIYQEPPRMNRYQRLRIIFWGPGFGLILGGVVWLLATYVLPPKVEWGYHLWKFVTSMIWINLFWSLFNFLPVLPLDGGQFLGAWMYERNPRLRGQIGCGVAAAVAVVALFLNQFFIALMFGLLAYTNYQIAEGRKVKFF